MRPALTAARDRLGADFFDWLTGVDELADGFTVAAFVCAVGTGVRSGSGGGDGGDALPAEDRLARGQGLIIKTRVPRARVVLELGGTAAVVGGSNFLAVGSFTRCSTRERNLWASLRPI